MYGRKGRLFFFAQRKFLFTLRDGRCFRTMPFSERYEGTTFISVCSGLVEQVDRPPGYVTSSREDERGWSDFFSWLRRYILICFLHFLHTLMVVEAFVWPLNIYLA